MNFIDPSTNYYREKRLSNLDNKPPPYAFAKDRIQWQIDTIKKRYKFQHGGKKKKKRKKG